MENMNVADVLGTLFLIYGVIDGYRKGFVKKGILFASSILTLVIVYMASPYVAGFFRKILPSAFSLENVLGTDSGIYTMLVLSGLGNEAENYMYVMASRILAVAVTYIIVRILLRTLLFSLEILTKVPGLSFINRMAGAAFGLLQQLLIAWLLLLVVAVLSMTPWGASLYEWIRSSVVLSFLYDHNLLLLIGVVLVLNT